MTDPIRPADAEFAEAQELMNRLLDGELSADGAARLERLVCDRQDIRQFYILQNHLWCNLAPLFTSTPAPADRDGSLDAEESMILPALSGDEFEDEPEPVELPPLVWPTAERTNPWRRRLYAVGTLAASVLLALTVALFWPRATPPVVSNPPRPAPVQPVLPPATQDLAPAPPEPVVAQPVLHAKLANAIGTQWDAPHAGLQVGQALPTEPLHLKAGLAEVRFDNGVSMILEAPARIHLRSDMRADLVQGKLVTTVPEAAHGFAVATASAQVIDLGTEFGVEVDAGGATRVEVFQGKVRAQPPAAQAAAPTTGPASPAARFVTRELVAGEAGRVAPGAAAFADVKPVPLSFVRDEEFSVREASASGSDYHRWLAHTYEVRRDPSLAAYYTFGKPAGADGLVPNRADRSAGRFDLTLGYAGNPGSRPAWAKGRWPEKGALDFNARAAQGVFIPKFPFTTTRRLSVGAWVYARGNAHWAAIAKNRGDKQEGPGQFSLGLYENDGTLVGRITQEDGQEILAREPAGSPIPLERWVHVAMVADGTTLRLYRDGTEVASVPCTGPTPTPTPTWLSIGYRPTATQRPTVTNRGEHWDGLIDEIVIFHRALSREEIQDAYEAGRPGA